MKIEQVAAQLYTLRDFLKTPAEIAASLKKVSDIGFKAVQASGLGPIADEEFRRLLDDLDLTLCATHESAQTILDQPELVVERLQKLGCAYTAYPYPAGVDFTQAAQVEKLARQLGHASEVLHAAGQVLTYHNHATELMRFGDATVLDYLFAQNAARHLQGEIDTYWIQFGGGDPVAWCEKLSGRLPLLHMKDYQIMPNNAPNFAEIGSGNLDWPRIIAAAEASGCLWFIVEQDTCPGDPYDSLKTSFDYIRANLCSSR